MWHQVSNGWKYQKETRHFGAANAEVLLNAYHSIISTFSRVTSMD